MSWSFLEVEEEEVDEGDEVQGDRSELFFSFFFSSFSSVRAAESSRVRAASETLVPNQAPAHGKRAREERRERD